MKNFFLLVIFIFFFLVIIYLFLYNKYLDIDVEEFNSYIKNNNISISNENIIEHYFEFLNYDNISSSDISIIEKETMNIVSIIPRTSLGDSISSTKYIFYIDTSSEKWNINHMKKTWKCRKGRGHTYWSARSCY